MICAARDVFVLCSGTRQVRATVAFCTLTHTRTLRIACSAIYKAERVLSLSQHSAEAPLGILHEESFGSPLNHAS